MVDTQIAARGISRKAILDAMRKVPRHLFVDEIFHGKAYGDFALPIGEGQTISQPYMVASMIDALELTGQERLLELGTGTGYQTAVLSMLAYKVFSIERIASMAVRARKTLDGLHASNVILKTGDGTLGWPDEAPFDAIIVAAGSPEVPSALVEQLNAGGRLIIPVGTEDKQRLVMITKKEVGIVREELSDCRFVKLVGKHGWQRP
ncbi:MAG: protein-L-isoaspartate O-methyltransferase [Deltaproteobacteria bacterium RIFCSPLOWO2_02_FULL_53_8]|nr:MAG: protein-L-isoaspartate O-methyltransferase [Deltaproteobacteria bacterium RIFCSPLOWO2_02_FULL_53_8]